MDPADEWRQAEQAEAAHQARRPQRAECDEEDPFADFDDDDLLRNLPRAFDAAPTDIGTIPATTAVTLPAFVTEGRAPGEVNEEAVGLDTLAETHQSGFFAASMADEDWGAYELTGQPDVEALRLPASPTSKLTPSPSAPRPGPPAPPVGVFASAVPAERPSFVLCGDDGRRLWVTASGMESKGSTAPHTEGTDPFLSNQSMPASSAYLDVVDDDEEDVTTTDGRGDTNTGPGPSRSLLGEVSVTDLLREARAALAEESAAKRAAQALADQRAEVEEEDVLLAGALDDIVTDDGLHTGDPVSPEARARRAKRAREGSMTAGDSHPHGDRAVGRPSASAGSKPPRTAAEDTLWVAKYTPRHFREVLSDESINLELLRWLKSWDPVVFESERGSAAAPAAGPPQPPEERIVVLVGPPGVGKTTLAHVLAAHCGYEAIEINASVERTASRLEGTIQLAVSSSGRVRRRPRPQHAGDGGAADVEATAPTLADHLLRPKCLIIDEMDGIASNVAQFLLRQDILRPVFCLCNDYYVPSLRLMRQRCRHVYHLPPIQPQRLLGRLEEICAREHLRVEQAALAELVQSSGGDIRSCLNTLQFLKGLPQVGQHGPNRTSHERHGTATMDMVRAAQGKDHKLDVWESWNMIFVKGERSRTLQLLKKECGVDYEALVAASTADHQSAIALRKARERARVLGAAAAPVQPPRASGAAQVRAVPIGFRVDPGYLLTSHELPRCADLPLLLDGLQENYCQRPYTDYTLRRTAAAAAGFARQDVLTTAAFTRTPTLFGFAEDFQLVTALTCYASCSTSNRGPRLQYPRQHAQLHRQQAEAEQIALTFREGCYTVSVVSHLWSDETISADVSGLLLRSLVDASVRLPSHAINTLSALPPNERRLMDASVARHAAYGLGYREVTRTDYAGGGGGWDAEARGKRSDWHLTPELDQLGGIRRPFSAPSDGASGVRGQHFRSSRSFGGQGQTTPATLAPPSAHTRRPTVELPPSSSTLSCRALTLREETKQLLQGEIHRYTVQRTAAAHKAHNTAVAARKRTETPNLKRGRVEETPSAAAGAKSEEETTVGAAEHGGAATPKAARTEAPTCPAARDSTEETVKSALHGAIREGVPSTSTATVKRDFFGRPIVPKASTPATPRGRVDASGAPTQSPSPGDAHGGAGGLALTPVRYVYHDGCTNAVKMPATFTDF